MKKIYLKFRNQTKSLYQGTVTCDDIIITDVTGAYQKEIEFIIDRKVMFTLHVSDCKLEHILDHEYKLYLINE